MQQGGLAGAGGRDEGDDLAGLQRQVGAAQHRQLARLGAVAPLDGGQAQRGHRSHSFRSASTGSSRAARQLG